MSKVALSIILPLYQAETHVSALFASLAEQAGIRHQHVEIVIWDDGSTDKTPQKIRKHISLLEKFHSVKLHRSSVNQGLFVTRLLAAKKAKGSFITFVDKQTRPYPDYITQLLKQNWPLVVGNPVMDKSRSSWDRLLYLLRKKLYYPYFGTEFPDLTLSPTQYQQFKNKGGGGALLVKREWFIQAATSLSAGKHRNDDSLLITRLTQLSPLRKTAKAKILYLNRTGFLENLAHLFWRGPKFIDFYLWPWNRYSPYIFGGLALLLLQPLLAFAFPPLFIIEIGGMVAVFVALALWLSEEVEDIPPTLILLPITVVSFALGCLLGIGIKLQAVIRK